MLQPVKVATPATAGKGLALVQVSVAPAGVVMRQGDRARVAGDGVAAGVLDRDDGLRGEARCRRSRRWAEAVKPSLAAVPTVMVELALVAAVNAAVGCVSV